MVSSHALKNAVNGGVERAFAHHTDSFMFRSLGQTFSADGDACNIKHAGQYSETIKNQASKEAPSTSTTKRPTIAQGVDAPSTTSTALRYFLMGSSDLQLVLGGRYRAPRFSVDEDLLS